MGYSRNGFSQLWYNYVNLNNWDELKYQHHPLNIGLVAASVLIVIAVTIWLGGCSLWTGPSLAITALLWASAFALASWVSVTSGSSKLAPIFVLGDGLHYSSCVILMAIFTQPPGSFAFTALYWAVMVYWGATHNLTFLNVLSLSLGPVLLCTISQQWLLLSFVGFAIACHVVLSQATTMRNRVQAQKTRSQTVVKQLDELMIGIIQQLQLRYGSVFHELKNSLAGVKLNARSLEQNPGDKEALQDLIADLDALTSRAHKAIHNIKVNATHKYWGLFRLGRLLDQLTPPPPLRLTRVGELPRVELKAKEDMINLVLSNLIDNAYQAGAKNVMVYAEIREKLTIQVCDDGPGVPQHVIKAAFAPVASKSTGLGLYFSKRLMTLMDGDLYLESTSPVGTTFVMEFDYRKVGDGVK